MMQIIRLNIWVYPRGEQTSACIRVLIKQNDLCKAMSCHAYRAYIMV